MCGIVGVIGSSNLSVSTLDLLKHRGPDSSNIWKSPEGEYPVALGHLRLSIIGLDTRGNQPMFSEDENYAIVFNGEIYNFIELKNKLQDKGYKFQSDTDTEVMLYGLIDEGWQFMHKCNGMWAFCLWDRKNRKAIFARDRFGKKPLFYTKLNNGELVFASEMKALFPLMDVVKPDPKINLYFKFLFDYEHTENCVIQGIKRIPPGHFIEYDDNNLLVKRWWNTLDHLETVPTKYEDQVERWRELFLDSVKLRMRADVKIGSALSGGLDSSAVFSAMSYITSQGWQNTRQSNDWQHGFCSHFPNSSLDEVKWAKIVTDALDINLEKVYIDPLNAGWSISKALYQVEDPYLTLPFPMLATYKAISNSGIKVTLDGHGADELFSGYGHLKYAITNATAKETAEILAIDRSTRTGIFKYDYKFIQLHSLAQKIKILASENSKFSRKVARKILGKIDWETFNYNLSYEDQKHPKFAEMGLFNQKLYEIFHITILPTLLRNYDRYSMASGVEIRMPFMDYRLVTYTFSLPWQSKLGGGFTKRIMRDALKGILPEPIRLRRDKIGWNAPLHEWLRGPLKNEITNLLLDKNKKDKWNHFQRISNPDYSDGENIWKEILPELWGKSIKP